MNQLEKLQATPCVTVEQVSRFREAAVEQAKDADKTISKLEALLLKHGVCTKCGEMYSHELSAPFADCNCGTSEWYKFTPYMKLEQKIEDMRLKIADLEWRRSQLEK